MQSIHLLQAEYWLSENSLQTARCLVERKCRNMAYLLRRFLPFRQKNYPDQAKILTVLINKMTAKNLAIAETQTRQKLMLAEAEISRLYWKGFALLCHCPKGWKRTYPRSRDSWNISLNIGYTMLNKFIANQLSEYGFSLEIGFLHSPQDGNEALVYDFQELFRQPLVDAALIPLFSRYAEHQLTNRKIVAACSELFQKPILYNHQNIHAATLINKELTGLLSAFNGKTMYVPYLHTWSHAKRKSPSNA